MDQMSSRGSFQPHSSRDSVKTHLWLQLGWGLLSLRACEGVLVGVVQPCACCQGVLCQITHG